MSAFSMLVLLAISATGVALGEAFLHRRRLNQIRYRIHVNGTRGKSSVTRLIAAGLRSGGIKTCAKTTGTLARMILPDGKELPIFRPSRANVIEQKRIIRAAVDEGSEALVIECMALQPALQSVCELKLVRSTHGVITNARADHLDVMGPTRLDVSRALSGTMPVAGTMYTAERRDDSLQVMSEAAADRGSSLATISIDEVDSITSDQMSGFSYLEHPENVALALRVCEAIGVDRDQAIQGMWSATPDPGAMRVYRRTCSERPLDFVNAFAANDPESTTQIWASTLSQFPDALKRVVVMNCRVDRIERSRSLAEVAADWEAVDYFVIVGSGTDVFLRSLLKRGVSADQVICLGSAEPHEITEAVARVASCGAMMMGIGNVYGTGFALAEFFENDRLWADENVSTTVEDHVLVEV